jgi:hypothetical protein
LNPTESTADAPLANLRQISLSWERTPPALHPVIKTTDIMLAAASRAYRPMLPPYIRTAALRAYGHSGGFSGDDPTK